MHAEHRMEKNKPNMNCNQSEWVSEIVCAMNCVRLMQFSSVIYLFYSGKNWCVFCDSNK